MDDLDMDAISTMLREMDAKAYASPIAMALGHLFFAMQ